MANNQKIFSNHHKNYLEDIFGEISSSDDEKENYRKEAHKQSNSLVEIDLDMPIITSTTTEGTNIKNSELDVLHSTESHHKNNHKRVKLIKVQASPLKLTVQDDTDFEDNGSLNPIKKHKSNILQEISYNFLKQLLGQN